MKHAFSALCVAAAIAISPQVADAVEYVTVENYFEGFDNVQTGNDQCAIGWGRIFDYTPLGPISYRVEAMGGMDDERSKNTNVFSNQWQETWDDETGATYATEDYIVTPEVNGKIAFYLSKKGSNVNDIPKIKAYTCTRNEDYTYTLGDMIDLGDIYINPAQSAHEWTLVEFTLPQSTHVALWIEHCYLDSFSADEAIIPQLRLLQLYGFNAEAYTLNADRDGNVEFNLSIKMVNRGNLPLYTTDSDFNFEVVNGGDVIKTVAIPDNLQPGDGTTVDFALPYKLADPTKSETLAVRCIENVSRTVSSTDIRLQANAHVPVLEISKDGSKLEKLNLGLYEETPMIPIVFANTGSDVLSISSITMPEGLSLDVEAPFTIEAGQKKDAILTVTTDKPVTGKITVESNTYGNVNGFTVNGAKVAPGTYTEDFSASTMPDRWVIAKSGAWTLRTDEGVLRSATSSSSAAKAILPKLKIADGSKLLFALTRTTRATYYECYVKIFASDDRANWTEIAKISSKDADTKLPGFDEYGYVEVDVPAGEKYLAFEGVYVNIDNIAVGTLAETGSDIYIHSYNAAASGMVNYPFEASVTIQNTGESTLGSNEYSVDLMLNGEKIATIDPEALPELTNAGASSTEFKFSHIPHAAVEGGELKANIKVGERIFESEATNIDIVPETMNTSVQVGKLNINLGDEHPSIPIRSSLNNSYSEFIYTASQLGMSQGDKIASIAFYYSIIAERNPKKTIKMWIENTDLSTPPTPERGKAFADTTSMTRVVCNDYIFARTTERVFDKFALLTLTFDESFEYDGRNLRIIVAQESSDFVAASFFVVGGGTTRWAADDNLADAKAANSMPISYIPAAFITLDKTAPHVSGSVSSAASPLEGAKIILSSEGVEYYGETDAEGKFNVEILQPARSYDAVIAAHTYTDATVDANVYSADTELGDFGMASNSPAEDVLDITAGTNDDMIFSWQAVTPGSLDTDVSYTVYVDGEKAAENLKDTSYTIENLTPGEHTFGVCAVFEPTGEASAISEIRAGYSSIISANTRGISITSVPGGVEITVDDAGTAMIFNASGMKVTEKQICAGTHRIAVAPGMYVVAVNGFATKISIR